MMCEDKRFYNQKGVMAQRYNLPGRRHGGGLDEDYNRDYGLAPPNLQRRAYAIKSRKEAKERSATQNRKDCKARSLERRRVTNISPEQTKCDKSVSKAVIPEHIAAKPTNTRPLKHDKESCLSDSNHLISEPPSLEKRRITNINPEQSKYEKSVSKAVIPKHIVENTTNSRPLKHENESCLSDSDHPMSEEDLDTNLIDDSDEEAWDLQDILPVAPKKTDGAILKLTHNAYPKNNPGNRISIDDFSPDRPVRKPTVLLYKRREPQALDLDLDDLDHLKAVTVLSEGPLDQLSRRHVGFNLGAPSVAMAGYDDVRERFVPRIGHRTKSLHESGMGNLKPILKRDSDLPGHRSNQMEYYDRFARHSRRGDGAVKLPPISAPPSNTSSPRRQRRKLKRETSMRINCSEEFASVVNDLGN